MIGSAFATTAQGVRDVGLDIAAMLWRDGPPQPGGDRGDGIAQVLGSTVADPLARMQFEYRGATIPRRLSVDAHESTALRLSPLDFVPDQVGLGAWAFGPAATGVPAAGGKESDTAASFTFDWPTSVASLLGTFHGSWLS